MEQSHRPILTGGDGMSRFEKNLFSFFSAESIALEWALAAFAFVWGISSMVTQIHHHTLTAIFEFNGVFWFTLNSVLVVLGAIRGLSLFHAKHEGSTRRIISSLLVCTWGTLAAYLLQHDTILFFAVIYASVTLIEFWVTMNLSLSGARACNGSDRR